jgi:zinc transport system permease protein|tara:strand:- start:1591 stop:2421 length:831 start_codon:yes stop_codon:yes gene_type:complete
MFDDFFVRALLAGIGVALVAGPLGCFVVWRRLAYFGDTLSHGALLGVAVGLLLQIHLPTAVFIVCTFIALALFTIRRRSMISSDALLGLLSHSALAIGLVVLGFLTWVRVDLMGLLFGDILAVSENDLLLIWIGALCTLSILTWIWKPLFAATVSQELAEAEGLEPRRTELIFMILMAAVIAISMKIVGVLLITSLLIIPAAASRRFATSPAQMLIVASVIGILSVIAGLLSSLTWDTPSGPSIVVAALICFLVSLTPFVNLFRSNLGASRNIGHE